MHTPLHAIYVEVSMPPLALSFIFHFAVRLPPTTNACIFRRDTQRWSWQRTQQLSSASWQEAPKCPRSLMRFLHPDLNPKPYSLNPKPEITDADLPCRCVLQLV